MLKRVTRRGRNARGTFIAASLFLANCQGIVTVDLAAEAPADSTVAQVLANLAGLEFRKEDGGTETLDFSSSESVDLTDYLNGDPLRLLTDEQLPEGTYTGVRLRFDEDESAKVVKANGGEFPIVLKDGNYADFDFTVDESKTRRESLTLTLDLRQSLSFNSGDNEYTLKPFLRSVPTDEAGQIEGAVSISCPSGSSLAEGGAVYLFEGEDVTPDDRDDDDAEPYATAAITRDSSNGAFSYALRFLPEGDYTFAVTCKGNIEDPTGNNDLSFRNIENLHVDQGETLSNDVGS